VLKSFLEENFQVELQTVQLSTKGLNWGEYELQGPVFTFSIDGKQVFDLPVSEVSNAVMQPTNKNEVALEFHQDSTLEDEDESLVDIRFFIPNRSTEDGGKTSAQIFHKNLLDVVDVSATTGKGIASLTKIAILTPRGRYDIEMFPTFMKLHGKTHDYKIAYESVSRLFQLPKPDGQHVFFIITVDPPIRQGGMKYPHIVMHFSKDEKVTLPINLPPELKEKEQFKNLPEEFKGAETYDVVNKLFWSLTQRKITTPGSFKSHGGNSAIKCALKANDGYLYPLERSFFFAHKPTLHLRFEEISSVEFARVTAGATAQSNRTFDLIVTTSDSAVHQFAGIQRQEYGNLFNFIQSKKLRIENPDDAQDMAPSVAEIAEEDEESSEDEDFIDIGEEEVPEEYDSASPEDDEAAGSDDERPKKEKKKDKGKEKAKEGKRKPSSENGEHKKKKKKHDEDDD